jgi:glutaredoxin-like protein NrdH
MVTIYSKPGCTQSEQTKRFLDVRQIKYTDIDISTNGEAYQDIVEEMGNPYTPVVITAVDKWYGFRIDKLKSLAVK